MRKLPLLLATSVGALGIFTAASAFASQVSDHGGAATVNAPNDDGQGVSAGDRNDDDAVETEASDGHHGDDSATADQQKGGDDQGDKSGDDSGESGDHQSGEHQSGEHSGEGGGSGGGGGEGGGSGGGGDD